MTSLNSQAPKTRLKTSKGMAKRIVRLAVSRYAISAYDIMDTYKFTKRHANRYISWLEDEGFLYLRYRKDRHNYYSATRKRNEIREIRRGVSRSQRA
jgi:predicted transcriptional regulator